MLSQDKISPCCSSLCKVDHHLLQSCHNDRDEPAVCQCRVQVRSKAQPHNFSRRGKGWLNDYIRLLFISNFYIASQVMIVYTTTTTYSCRVSLNPSIQTWKHTDILPAFRIRIHPDPLHFAEPDPLQSLLRIQIRIRIHLRKHWFGSG